MDGFFNTEISDDDLITQWLNTAMMSQVTSEKLEAFHKAHEYLIRKAPQLLPEFLPSVLNFTTDRNGDIKKALVGFIEEACKIRESLLIKVMVNLHMLLCDEKIPVQKRVIQAAISIYRKMLSWLCKAPNVTDEMEQAWSQLNLIKVEIANMIDSDNDGVRTCSVKFLECVVLLQTYPDYVEKTGNEFSLEDVPLTLKIARRRKLEEEAHNIFDLLIKFNGSPHISSANLFASVGALTNISKQRSEFMPKVVSAIETLYSNLPPTLSTTQVNSVRKKLKLELVSLIKHPAAFDFVNTISPMLMDLGHSQQEIIKMIPKVDEIRKSVKRTVPTESTQTSKKARLEPQIEVDPDTLEMEQKLAMELNEKYVLDNFTSEVAIQLLLYGMPKIPNTMPPQFTADYTTFMKGGQVGQLKALATLLAEQFIEAGLGPGAQVIGKTSVREKPVEPPKETNKRDIEEEEKDKGHKKERVKVPRIKTLKLTEITKPLDKLTKESLMLGGIKRLLLADKVGAGQLRQKVIITLAATFTESVRECILTFLLSDVQAHLDLILAWLYEEYSIMQGFSRIPALRREGRIDQSYNMLLSTFVGSSSSDAGLLSRLLLEAPLVTDQVLEEICNICRDEERSVWALGLLRDLAVQRPPKQMMFLNALLTHTTHESTSVRDNAVAHVLDLYKRSDLKAIIEEFARAHLEFLRLPTPPENLFGNNQGRLTGAENWNDDIVRACLLPYISLLPENESLIHDLAKVYVQTNADIKRTILRLLEPPIRTMGMDSTELLKLVEECPKGAETLVTRVIHILTDKGHPSSQLVQRVRDLYQTRVSDVRFLIPVLNGLTKKEVISALPKLIKLNPVVVREVFNRLLGLHGDSPISPTELLVALHLIDLGKADLKTVMKATSMCLNEKMVFTQEVLAVVLQQLMDQTPLPTLLMRTVIQALGTHPRLSGFVMNILQRLILKQVWKQKIVWEGFVKCCQRTKPQSFSVLMQLPAPQLSEALTMCPELRDPLKDYVLNFSESQKAHIPVAVQEILLGPVPVQCPAEISILPIVTTEMPPLPTSMEPLPPGME